MGLSLVWVPLASVLGCVRCGGWACVDPVTDVSAFPYRVSFNGDLARAPGLFLVDANTSPFRSEDATPGSRVSVPVPALLGRVGQAGLPGAFRCASLFLWTFCPSALLGPLRAGVALVLFFLFFCLLSFLFFFRCLRPRFLCLFVIPGPGCPWPWRSALSSARPLAPPPHFLHAALFFLGAGVVLFLFVCLRACVLCFGFPLFSFRCPWLLRRLLPSPPASFVFFLPPFFSFPASVPFVCAFFWLFAFLGALVLCPCFLPTPRSFFVCFFHLSFFFPFFGFFWGGLVPRASPSCGVGRRAVPFGGVCYLVLVPPVVLVERPPPTYGLGVLWCFPSLPPRLFFFFVSCSRLWCCSPCGLCATVLCLVGVLVSCCSVRLFVVSSRCLLSCVVACCALFFLVVVCRGVWCGAVLRCCPLCVVPCCAGLLLRAAAWRIAGPRLFFACCIAALPLGC